MEIETSNKKNEQRNQCSTVINLQKFQEYFISKAWHLEIFKFQFKDIEMYVKGQDAYFMHEKELNENSNCINLI